MRDIDFLRMINKRRAADMDAAEPPDLAGFWVECRVGEYFDPLWWETTVATAETAGKSAALAYKIGDKAWAVKLYCRHAMPGVGFGEQVLVMSLDAFRILIAHRSDNPLLRLAELTAATRKAQK